MDNYFIAYKGRALFLIIKYVLLKSQDSPKHNFGMCTNYKAYTSTDGVFHISSSLCIASQITGTAFEASDSKFILLFQKP